MSITVPPSGTFFTLADLGLPTSQAEFLAIWLRNMQASFPGYLPADGSPEYVQAQIMASWAAQAAQLATAGSVELFRQFGTQLLNLPYEQGDPATAQLTVQTVDQGGHELPALTQLTLTLGTSQVAFQTAADLTIPAGSSSGTVLVEAVSAGTAFNGATNPASLVQQTDWVQSLTVSGAANGGVDQEDDDEYANRLAQTLQLLTPRPITAENFATLSLSFTPASGTDQTEIGRACAVDGYNAVTETLMNERCVTVCVTDTQGGALNSDTMTALAAWLESLRETNFLVFVIAPTYSTIYVTASVVATPGYDVPTVQAAVQAAILNFLTPANFGIPQGAVSGWNNVTTIYQSVLSNVIQQTAGVDHIVDGTLRFGTSANPTNTADLVLAGIAPMPETTTTSVPTAGITVTTS